ncbi:MULTISPECIES: alpha/beta hydrolase [Planococcus]|uniref:Alpha/beta hydrolase n=1 Tax=Planococcus faecalis TaxID=1598147 RepID=A0ABN4XM49_9BACL|nr:MULTISPECIES: alpha/beta hydrolase [Planococcus]AQU78187.1 alpha/beta hydrolase [Planococcus faecalis]MDJ0331176.1 alpha/beta hydrolase [Planococcus sp. S3-L1]OHX53787.1 carboxymethylenebutenolidase [Planococcus faecalis]
MKKWLLRSAVAVFVLLVIAVAGFVVYAQFDYGPSEILTEKVDLSALESDAEGLIFQPATPNGKGVILYQGAKVEKEAYAYLGQSLSEQGFVVSIPQLPLNFGILGSGTAHDIIEEHSEVEEWFLGGHSLGGVAASFYAEDSSAKLSGLYFLGAYPAGDFSDSRLPMLSIYAERDGLSTVTDIEESRKLFSDDSVFVEIKGGNHAQFGLYGEQKGDNAAEIPAIEQQDQVVKALTEWINKNSP